MHAINQNRQCAGADKAAALRLGAILRRTVERFGVIVCRTVAVDVGGSNIMIVIMMQGLKTGILIKEAMGGARAIRKGERYGRSKNAKEVQRRQPQR